MERVRLRRKGTQHRRVTRSAIEIAASQGRKSKNSEL